MTIKQYRQARTVVALYVAVLVSMAVASNNNLLAITGVLTGMLVLLVARKRTKIIVDERILSVAEKASRLTYAIVTPVIGLGSFFLYTFGRSDTRLVLPAIILSYVTLFILATYSLAYYFLSRQYGGSDEE